MVDVSKETRRRAGEKCFLLSVFTVKCPPKLTPLSTLCNQTQRPCDLMISHAGKNWELLLTQAKIHSLIYHAVAEFFTGIIRAKQIKQSKMLCQFVFGWQIFTHHSAIDTIWSSGWFPTTWSIKASFPAGLLRAKFKNKIKKFHLKKLKNDSKVICATF